MSDGRAAVGAMSGRPPADRFSLVGQRAVIATMHGKERVIAPILVHSLGLSVEVPTNFDTDRFGTFTGEIERTGSQLDAARAKIQAAFDHIPDARVAVASEGSFGPDPVIPFLGLGRELVLLVDRESGLELTGHDATLETNYAHTIVHDLAAALAFAERVHFPDHAVIVMGCRGDQPAPDIALHKGIVRTDQVERAVQDVLALAGVAFVETDMRAYLNPTRMRAIGRATTDLVRRFRSRCPVCAHPGFDVTERVPGLPCEWCGAATRVVKTEVLSCADCGHHTERPAVDPATADPGQCALCNP